MLFSLVVAFGAGFVSFLAPCMVPLLPAYVGVLSGSSAGASEEEQPARLLRGALLYVAGFSTVFVTLGLLAGSVGRAIRESGGPVQRVGGVLVLLLAAALLLDARLGLLARFAAPGGERVSRVAAHRSAWMPFVLGVVFGTAFTPCVGPFLGAVLTLSALQGASLEGGLLLGVYSLGLGVPFVLAALGVGASPSLARRLTRAARPVSLAGSVLLAVLGVLLVSGAYGQLASWLAETLPFTLT